MTFLAKKKSVLALTIALLLAGAATTASAYDRYDSNDGYYNNDGYSSSDRYDNSYDNSYDSRYDSNYDNGYDNTDRYDNRYSTGGADLDCDGVYDRYDRNIRDSHDADCDGIANNYDHSYNQRYSTHSRHSQRWNVGSHLPRAYYGSSYYVDYQPYGLSRPGYGYRWNRVGNDVYLVSTRSGLIVRVEYNVFR
jgi:Ni/Co efflux regulator RcnB